MNKEEWVSTKQKLPPEKLTVDCKFANGKIIDAHIEGNFWIFPPSQVDFFTIKSGVTHWKNKKINN